MRAGHRDAGADSGSSPEHRVGRGDFFGRCVGRDGQYHGVLGADILQRREMRPLPEADLEQRPTRADFLDGESDLAPRIGESRGERLGKVVGGEGRVDGQRVRVEGAAAADDGPVGERAARVQRGLTGECGQSRSRQGQPDTSAQRSQIRVQHGADGEHAGGPRADGRLRGQLEGLRVGRPDRRVSAADEDGLVGMGHASRVGARPGALPAMTHQKVRRRRACAGAGRTLVGKTLRRFGPPELWTPELGAKERARTGATLSASAAPPAAAHRSARPTPAAGTAAGPRPLWRRHTTRGTAARPAAPRRAGW